MLLSQGRRIFTLLEPHTILGSLLILFDRFFLGLDQKWINFVESSLYVLLFLSSSQHEFAGNKDQEHDLGIFHSVHKPWKNLRLVLKQLAHLGFPE